MKLKFTHKLGLGPWDSDSGLGEQGLGLGLGNGGLELGLQSGESGGFTEVCISMDRPSSMDSPAFFNFFSSMES